MRLNLTNIDKAIKESKEKKVVVDPFEEMIVLFKDFIENNTMVKGTRLQMREEKKGYYIVFQSNTDPDNVWANLRNTGCVFTYTSILRIIKRLKPKNKLRRYFEEYSISTGTRKY